MEYKKFSELAAQTENPYPKALKVDKINLYNKEILLKEFKEFPSTFLPNSNFSIVLAEFEGHEITFNAGVTLTNQLKRNKDSLPFLATIKQVKGKNNKIYDTFS